MTSSIGSSPANFRPAPPFPGELELTVQHEVSRMTVREAVKTLEAQGVVRIERGRGTYVNPVGRCGPRWKLCSGPHPRAIRTRRH